MERDGHDEEPCRGLELAKNQLWLRSNWITRLMVSSPSSSERADEELSYCSSSLRRSLSCSSLPEVPRRFMRAVEEEDAEDGDLLLRFLGCGKRCAGGSSSSWLGQPLNINMERRMELGVSERFTEEGLLSAWCLYGSVDSSRSRSMSSRRYVDREPNTIIRGFEGGGEGEVKLDPDGPLPYSTFEDQKSGRRFGIREKCNDEIHPLLTSLLHPKLVADNDEVLLSRVEEFVHQESVLSSKPGTYDTLERRAIGSEWISRWSYKQVHNDRRDWSSNENVLRLRSAHVPSAQAMAIVGKSSGIGRESYSAASKSSRISGEGSVSLSMASESSSKTSDDDPSC